MELSSSGGYEPALLLRGTLSTPRPARILTLPLKLSLAHYAVRRHPLSPTSAPKVSASLAPSLLLREYSPPATAALALGEVGQQGWFLCDADRMGFEGSVAAVAAGEELQPGQIYFVLPAEMLRRCLTGEEVASLAVKASAALVKAATASSAGGRRRRGSVTPLVFAPSEEDYSDETLAKFAVKPAVPQKRRVAYRGGRSPPRFSPDLTAILESE